MMRRLIWFFLFPVIFFSCKKTYTEPPVVEPPLVPAEDTTHLKQYTKDLTIVNWNIEWFGSATNFNGNLNLQEANAAKILKYLNADLYGICEVVDTARFGRMVRNSLGDDFRYKISFYPTMLNAQKMAFVYNRNIFRNISVRRFLGTSTFADNFFGGRTPWLLTAEVVVNQQRIPVSYFLMHAKAYADASSYNRRLNGSIEMKDSLDRYFTGKNFMILGDFNDHLKGSILAGKPSPYQNFVVDTKNYNPISLPLNAPGYQSTISYQHSVIDNQVISASMTKWYMNTSVKIRTDVVSVVPDFITRNTSDHYPVSSVFRF